MLDNKIDKTPYEEVIVNAEAAIADVGRTCHYSQYREACDEVLSNLYSSLEKLGISDKVLLLIAADFVDIIMANRPLALAVAA